MSHFKEIDGMQFYHAGECTSGPNCEKSQFILLWHSKSTLGESCLDQSINVIEVTNDKQYGEILKIHEVVSQESNTKRYPRYKLQIVPPRKNNEQLNN